MRNFVLLLFSCLVLVHPAAAQEEVVLSNKEGKKIYAQLSDYDPDTGMVEIRHQANDRKVTFDIELLDEASKELVKRWYAEYTVARLIRVSIERVATGAPGQRVFRIELSSMSDVVVEDIRIDYVIAIRHSKMAKEENATNNNRGKPVYKRVTSGSLIEGSIDIDRLEPRVPVTVETEPVQVASKQEVNSGKGETREVSNKHSLMGAVIKLYVGEKLVREEESRPGAAQYIERFRD